MGGIQPSVANLTFMKTTADSLFGKDYISAMVAAGRHEYHLCTTGVIMGGHALIGMEDNLYIGKGQLVKSNGEMVENMVRIMSQLDREPTTPQETRDMLKLKGKEGAGFLSLSAKFLTLQWGEKGVIRYLLSD
jgi:uncharacterized protein (DUF849 family)